MMNTRKMLRHAIDRLATILLWAAGLFVVALLLALSVYLIHIGASSVSWSFLTSQPSEIGPGGGIGPEIYNSFYLLILTLLFTVPIAIASAIYLQEYARPGPFPNIVQFCAESLATIPSIVMGLFGLLLFVYILKWRFSAIGGALTLTILNLPTLMRITQESLATVPATLREASMALGATRWRTIMRVILPAGLPQIMTGIILVAGRILGETAALIYTAGVSVASNAPYDLNPFHTAETLSVHLWYTHSESLVPDVARIGNASAFVLLVMVFVSNIVARAIGILLRRKLSGQSSWQWRSTARRS